jgi:hypothetical protein
MAKNYQFRGIAGLTTFLRTLLVLSALLSLISIWSSALQLELFNRWGNFTLEEVESNDLRERIVALANFVLNLFIVIIFAIWIVRANKNVRALGATDLRMTPGWAVGFFFIPIMNLWKPYQAMKDLWEASHYFSSNPTKTGSILPIWWALWLLSNFVANISFRLTLSAEGLEQLRTATTVEIINEVLNIPLCIVAILLVSQIGKAQTTAAQMAHDQEMDQTAQHDGFASA